ncbi:GPI mannosyltransferase 1 [Malassezia yamatoensis]|uniref:GPI mannosyltransferase 1 n=1 Tax=Malassezia yamatoensis TaxID=253288 RepID=A0AAJ5Z2F2_9BASI|nr:GPI mannosyltransferase 1 [Malassezia yamatoensis]
MHAKNWRWTYVVIGVLLRVVLLLWGDWQDSHTKLPYTDVDYSVYNDGAYYLSSGCRLEDTVDSALYEAESDLFDEPELAAKANCARGYVPAVARFVLKNDPARAGSQDTASAALEGHSWLLSLSKHCSRITSPIFRYVATLGDPYARATYRYTPLLALLLSPAQLLHSGPKYWGKLLFAAADIFCAVLMWLILDTRAMHHPRLAQRQAWATHLPGVLWLMNPFPAQIATRGSADSLVGVMILGCLALLLRATPEMQLVGLHAVPGDIAEKSTERRDPNELRVADEKAWYAAAALLALAVHLKLYPVIYGWSILAHLVTYRRHAIRILCHIDQPSTADVLQLGLEFAAVSGLIYAALNLFVWLVWGQPFIQHALLYHVARQDHRHNFSVYFLSTYLAPAFDVSSTSEWIRLGYTLVQSPIWSFLPQLMTSAYIGLKMGGHDLVLSCALQTMAFVAWNKVSTSQYFLWYLQFVPIIATTLYFPSVKPVAFLVAFWVTAQAVWLHFAYQLEFQAKNQFVALWLSSLGLLAMHVYIMQSCLEAWTAWRARERIALAKQA